MASYKSKKSLEPQVEFINYEIPEKKNNKSFAKRERNLNNNILNNSFNSQSDFSKQTEFSRSSTSLKKSDYKNVKKSNDIITIGKQKIRQTKIRPTLSEHLEHHDEIIDYLTREIEKRQEKGEGGIKTLKITRKMVTNLKKEVPNIKRYEKKSTETSGGLKKKYAISRELERFLKLPKGTMISRQEVTCAICVYSHIKEGELRPSMKKWEHLNPGGSRNLQNPFDKRTIIPDKKLSKLLKYKEYQNDIISGKINKKTVDKVSGETIIKPATSDSLHYCTIQKLISHHFIIEN